MIEEVNKMSEISTLKKPLETAEEYVQSLRDMKTEIWALGEKITGIPDHPLFVPHVNAVAKTYEMPFPVKSHLTGPYHQPLQPYPPEHRRPGGQGKNAAGPQPADRLLHPALRRDGRAQRDLHRHL